MKKTNPYLEQIHRILPRLLALYDLDPLSPTYGMGDRFRWAWRLIDFGSAKFQGAANGLARLLAHGFLPRELSVASVLRRIDGMFLGVDALRNPNGSVPEAFPSESSFGLTGFVANDLLNAVILLEDHLETERRSAYLDVVRPMIRFLQQNDETHGFISNHLAGAASALLKWMVLTGEGTDRRAGELLGRVLEAQSVEGWFPEYGGADPGYQTLCVAYLAELHELAPGLGLYEPLRNALRFLIYFAHPDGSFGGLYGSRNTRFFAPAGVETLAPELPEAAALALFMRNSIERRLTVTLEVMDGQNLIPFFNNYCWAAVLADSNTAENVHAVELPALALQPHRQVFREAGLVVDRGLEHYTIVSWHKGGVCYHFSRRGDRPLIDAGVVARAPDGNYYSTQGYRTENDIRLDQDTVVVTAALTSLNRRLPNTFEFMLLRLLGCSLMRSRRFAGWVKRVVARRLFTSRKVASVVNQRTVCFGPALSIEDRWQTSTQGFRRLEIKGPFSAIHMASQGYWQLQDDLVDDD